MRISSYFWCYHDYLCIWYYGRYYLINSMHYLRHQIKKYSFKITLLSMFLHYFDFVFKQTLWAVSTVKFCRILLCTVEISNQIWGLFNGQLEILALINIFIRIASSTLKSCRQDAEGKILRNKESYCTQIKWITT